jgi:hypothetical protein
MIKEEELELKDELNAFMGILINSKENYSYY